MAVDRPPDEVYFREVVLQRYLKWWQRWTSSVMELVRSIDRLARVMRARPQTVNDIEPRFHPIIITWVAGFTRVLTILDENMDELRFAAQIETNDGAPGALHAEIRDLMPLLRPSVIGRPRERELPQVLRDTYCGRPSYRCTPAVVAALPLVRREIVTWALDMHRAFGEFDKYTYAFADDCDRFLAPRRGMRKGKKFARLMRE